MGIWETMITIAVFCLAAHAVLTDIEAWMSKKKLRNRDDRVDKTDQPRKEL